MTTSIAFDIVDCGLEISYNPDPSLDPTQTEWLTDPNSSRDALQRLRILKTRETGGQQQIPNIIGRDTGVNIDYDNISHTYEVLKMRRKAEVLQNKNKNFSTKKKEYSNAVKGINIKYSSRTRLRQLVESNQCQNQPPIVKPAYKSGIKNDNTPLTYNKSIPLFNKL